MAPQRCDLCKHGFDPSEAPDKRTARSKYGKCEKCCPLYIRAVPADGFIVESTEDGWLAVKPFTYSDLCGEAGDQNPIEGCFNDNYFFSEDSAKKYLFSCAQENDATILKNPNNSIF